MRRLSMFMLAAVMGLGTPVVVQAAPGDEPGMQRRRGGDPGAREQRFLDLLQRRDAERHAKVMEIRRDRPALYRALVGQTAMQIRAGRGENSAGQVRTLIDEAYTLKGQIDAYEAGDARAQKKLVPEIQATVGRLFELRQQLRRQQLAAMEQRLERLRGEISDRDKNKDEIVEEFTDSMLGAVKGGL